MAILPFASSRNRAPACAASAWCLPKLSGPKCEGNSPGGERNMALVPVPSRDGTITTSASTAKTASISPPLTQGKSSGNRSSAVTPSLAQISDAASTEALSEVCAVSRITRQPNPSAIAAIPASAVTT